MGHLSINPIDNLLTLYLILLPVNRPFYSSGLGVLAFDMSEREAEKYGCMRLTSF